MFADAHKAPTVDWSLLSDAMAFYTARGYTPVEVPYAVTAGRAMLTCRPEHLQFVDDLVLVGSAEQGFLELDLTGHLAAGRYVALTPCFRREPSYTTYRRPWFMKVELYVTDRTDSIRLSGVISDALAFFRARARHPEAIETVATPEGIDIEYRGMEIGSYGIRKVGDHSWIYATGIAEPRFSAIDRAP